MSRTVKKVLVFFTLLCIVVVVVFAVELMLLNRDAADDDSLQTPPAGNSGAETAGTSTPPPTGSSPPTDTEPPEETPTDSATSPPAHSPGEQLYSLPIIIDGVSLELYADEEQFDFDIMDVDYVFIYKDGGEAMLVIVLDYLPQGAAQRARTAGFLDRFTGSSVESFVEDERELGQSSLSGAYITAVSGDTTYEAWICAIPDDKEALGITLVINYANDTQKEALYGILDTVEIVPAEVDGDDDLIDD